LSILASAPFTRQKAWIGDIMEELQTFQAAAREGGFVAAKESKDSTVLWLRRATPDASTGTRQRMCLDSVTKSATVFWTNARGQTESKTFRNANALREWLSGTLVPG
jgi:hypothetical protein